MKDMSALCQVRTFHISAYVAKIGMLLHRTIEQVRVISIHTRTFLPHVNSDLAVLPSQKP